MTKHYLEIISMNAQASIQDLGRINAQHLGFSASGAADEHAFLSANKLIVAHQNEVCSEKNKAQRQCAALEITLGQISFRANTACIIAIAGADCHARINNSIVKNWQSYQLQANDIIEFAMPKTGLHSYLAVLGGVRLDANQPPWLGSFAQTQHEMALNTTGKQLSVSSKLYFSEQTFPTTVQSQLVIAQVVAPSNLSKPAICYAQQQLTLRFMASKLFLQLSEEKQQAFLAASYSISADSNRMGYRLINKNGPVSSRSIDMLTTELRASSALSKPVTYGMIQFPTNEQPIILMKERQTMGGYPVLGTVMQTDLFRLSQMRPGQTVKFTVISIEQAQQQLQAFYQKF